MQDPPEYGRAGARLKFLWQCTGLSGDWKVTWTRVAFLDCQPWRGVRVHLKCVFSRHAVHCHELVGTVKRPSQPSDTMTAPRAHRPFSSGGLSKASAP